MTGNTLTHEFLFLLVFFLLYFVVPAMLVSSSYPVSCW